MKACVLALTCLFFLSGCANFSKYSPNDRTAEGIKIKLGSKDNLKVGDRMRILKPIRGSKDGVSASLGVETIGELLIVKVLADHEAIGRLEKEVSLDENVYFEQM